MKNCSETSGNTENTKGETGISAHTTTKYKEIKSIKGTRSKIPQNIIKIQFWQNKIMAKEYYYYNNFLLTQQMT